MRLHAHSSSSSERASSSVIPPNSRFLTVWLPADLLTASTRKASCYASEPLLLMTTKEVGMSVPCNGYHPIDVLAIGTEIVPTKPQGSSGYQISTAISACNLPIVCFVNA